MPGYVLSLVFLCYGLARDEFEWTGRRYRWASLYDITVSDPDAE